jgi:hypothetical protein
MLLSYPSKALHKRPVYAGCLFRAACRANDAFYIRHLRCLSVYEGDDDEIFLVTSVRSTVVPAGLSLGIPNTRMTDEEY